MIREYDKKIILEDGTEFYGFGFGADSEKIVEVVFNTSMVGYQEILSDPSYTGQAVVMTYPLIGNYGMCADDYETNVPTISALIVRNTMNSPPISGRKNPWSRSCSAMGSPGSPVWIHAAWLGTSGAKAPARD